MTREERYNDIQKARATFFNALAVGAIIAGGLSSLADGQMFAALAFTVAGLVLHYVATTHLKSMKVKTNE